jgi:hypothetical protein
VGDEKLNQRYVTQINHPAKEEQNENKKRKGKEKEELERVSWCDQNENILDTTAVCLCTS